MVADNQTSKVAKRHEGKPSPTQGPTVIANDPSDRDEGWASTRRISGSASKALNNVLANQAVNALWLPSRTPDVDRDRMLQAAVAAMMEFKPTDGIEGMMAAQAVGLHAGAMECLRRSMIQDQPFEVADKLRRQGANMSRAFLDVVGALDRKRGKGAHQIVRIERVQVAPGGQAAIIGNMTTAPGQSPALAGEGGYERQGRGEPHAPPARLAHDATPGAILPPLPGQDPNREALPVASHAERPLPNARRCQHGT